MNSAICDLMSI